LHVKYVPAAKNTRATIEELLYMVFSMRIIMCSGAPYTDKTVNVKQKLISGHEPQMGLDTMMD
jgi:hypothetical protein